MPAKHQISLAINANTYNAFKALADAQDLSLSKTTRQILESVTPEILNLAKSINLAKQHLKNKDTDLKDHLQSIIATASAKLDEAKQINLNDL